MLRTLKNDKLKHTSFNFCNSAKYILDVFGTLLNKTFS